MRFDPVSNGWCDRSARTRPDEDRHTAQKNPKARVAATLAHPVGPFVSAICRHLRKHLGGKDHLVDVDAGGFPLRLSHASGGRIGPSRFVVIATFVVKGEVFC